MRYSQIKQALKEAEIIDEVSMSPSSLEAFANSPEADGMLMGIEFEMCVPNASTGDDEPEWEYDYNQNESAYDIDDIVSSVMVILVTWVAVMQIVLEVRCSMNT
jgi:hypothetical protein